MKAEFLDYYRANLMHLREHAKEFSAQYPKIAQRLNLGQLDYQDPFVERLLEGTAFLAARVEKKLDDGYPLILQHLIQRICPIFTSQLPAMATVSFEEVAEENPCVTVTPDTRFELKVVQLKQQLTFCPMWEDTILPLQIQDCVYKLSLLDDLSPNELKSHDYKAGLKFRFACGLGPDAYEALPDDLNCYLNLVDSQASQLKENLQCNLEGVYLKTSEGEIRLEGITVESRLYKERTSIFAQALQMMPGLGKLFLYLNYPQLSRFLCIKQLGRVLRERQIMQGELIFCFSKSWPLTRRVSADSLRFNHLPLVNLFAIRSNRIRITQQPEFLVEVDNTEPLNYEIYSISELELFDSSNRVRYHAYPFYSFRYQEQDQGKPVLFAQNRRQRLDGLYKKRSNYVKTDVFVGISGEDYNSAVHETTDFTALCYASNADLSLFAVTDQAFVSKDGSLRGVFSSPLSKPRPPLVLRGDVEGMERFSFMMMNLTAFLRQDEEVSLNVLRTLLRTFAPGTQEERESLAQALRSVTSRPLVFRFVKRGAVYYEQGFELELCINAKQLAGMGGYNFGEALYGLLYNFRAINVDVDVILREAERGVVRAWKSGAR